MEKLSDAFSELLSAVLSLQHPTDISVHPAGDQVAVKLEPSFTRPEESIQSRIWVVSGDGETRQITSGPGSDALPRWSPNGEALAFASDRDHPGRMSLFLLEDLDGKAEPWGRIDGFVEDIGWAPDGESLLVQAADPGADAAAVDSAVKLTEKHADPDVQRPGEAWRRLYRVDAAGGSTEEVGPTGVSVWEFDLVDGDHAIAVASRDPSERGWYTAHLALLDLASRTHRELYRPVWQIQSPAAQAVGQWAACTEGWASDRALVAGDLKAVEIETGRVVDLSAGTGDVTWASWKDEKSLWFAGWSGLGSADGVVNLDGTVEFRNEDEAIVGPNSFYGSIAPSSDGSVWAIRESDGQPSELVRREADEPAWSQVSHFNSVPESVGEIYPTIEEVTWEGADSLEIHGLLMRPHDHEGGPMPMVVDVHGGPTWAWKHAFDPGFALPLTGAGYAVFMPNYRGSTGRGQTYTQLNVGDPGGKEFEDILRGVRWAVEEGIATPDRIGIMGASYGGYMTAWATATSDAFSAAVMISGISNLVSCHHTCNNSPFYEYITQKNPYEPDDLALYMDRSPVARIAGATTPTLILHGALDLCTPLGQAQEFYQALLENDVTTELVTYPREGHGFHERDHQLDAWSRIRSWFDRYLKDSE